MSFMGWQVQREKVKATSQSFFRECAELSPSLRHLKLLIQSLLSSRINYCRQVVPADEEQLKELHEGISKAVTRILGLSSSHIGGKTVSLMMLPEDIGAGIGIPDPEVFGLLQDARALLLGIESKDNRRCAAIWCAIRHALDEEGRMRPRGGEGESAGREGSSRTG